MLHLTVKITNLQNVNETHVLFIKHIWHRVFHSGIPVSEEEIILGVMMNTKFLKSLILFSLTSLVVTNNLFAGQMPQGGSDRGGGDAFVIRSKIFNAKKDNLVKQVNDLFTGKSNVDIKSVMAWFNQANFNLSDAKANAILKDMRDRGFGSDVYKTQFKLEKTCLDKNGISKTATTSMNEMNSEICINAEKFVNEFGPYIQDSDVVGLLMHEYSHHFGYEDADHSFASSIAESYQKDSERRNEEGEPLNYLIK
jgi:hypothetical protein